MRNSTSFSVRAAMLLLLAVLTTTTAQATDYISDVLIIGTSSSPSTPVGYTKINQDLNAGCGSKSYYIYLFYKKVSNPTSSSQVITDFILFKGHDHPDSFDYNGRTYYLADYEGDSEFDGDLNKKAGGDYIYLYYTRQHSDDFTAVTTNIFFNTSQNGAVGNKQDPTTGYNLNAGTGGDVIYMHLTKAKTPVFLPEVTSDYTAQNGDILTGTLGRNVKISIANGASVTLKNATIDRDDNNSNRQWAGLACIGSATINLEGTNKVTGFCNSPGIQVPYTCTVTINGTGSLEVTGRDNAAGIGAGGSAGAFSGPIVINGGTITAQGGSNAAGIGSGYYDSGNSTCDGITINGGTVTATGGSNAAGIGGGNGSNCGNITISTGVTSVTATKGSGAPNSIGAGKSGNCGTVTIGGVATGNVAQSPITYNPSVNYKYTVQFNSNGGTGSMANQEFLYGFEQKLRANNFTYYEGHDFSRWNTKSDGAGYTYNNGQSVTSILATLWQ